MLNADVDATRCTERITRVCAQWEGHAKIFLMQTLQEKCRQNQNPPDGNQPPGFFLQTKLLSCCYAPCGESSARNFDMARRMMDLIAREFLNCRAQSSFLECCREPEVQPARKCSDLETSGFFVGLQHCASNRLET